MRLHEVTQEPNSYNDNKGRTAFMPTNALARKLGHEWSGPHTLKKVGITITMHNVPPGRDNMMVFINSLVGHTYKVPGKKKKR